MTKDDKQPKRIYPELFPGEKVRPALTGKMWAAISQIAAREDSRPVLASIGVESDRVMAADGFALAVVACSNQITESPTELTEKADLPPWSRLLVSREHMKGWAGKAKAISFTRSNPRRAKMVVTQAKSPDLITQEIYTIDGTFPDYKQIVPEIAEPILFEDGKAVIFAVSAQRLKRACELAIALDPGSTAEHDTAMKFQIPGRSSSFQTNHNAIRIDTAGENPAVIVLMPMVMPS